MNKSNVDNGIRVLYLHRFNENMVNIYMIVNLSELVETWNTGDQWSSLNIYKSCVKRKCHLFYIISYNSYTLF